MPFTFHESFQQVLSAASASCSCGAGGNHPYRHGARCAVTTVYEKWVSDATSRWTILRAVPTRASNRQAAEQSFEEG